VPNKTSDINNAVSDINNAVSCYEDASLPLRDCLPDFDEICGTAINFVFFSSGQR